MTASPSRGSTRTAAVTQLEHGTRFRAQFSGNVVLFIFNYKIFSIYYKYYVHTNTLYCRAITVRPKNLEHRRVWGTRDLNEGYMYLRKYIIYQKPMGHLLYTKKL